MPFFAISRRINERVLWLGGDSVTDGSVLSLSRDEDGDLDVDSMHTVLREFQQELRDTQRDRVYLNLKRNKDSGTQTSNFECVGLFT